MPNKEVKKVMETIMWIELMKQAKRQGLTPDQVRSFLKVKKKERK